MLMLYFLLQGGKKSSRNTTNRYRRLEENGNRERGYEGLELAYMRYCAGGSEEDEDSDKHPEIECLDTPGALS